LGLGAVAAIPDADPASNFNFPWQLLFSHLGTDRWHWSTRHGVSFSSPNNDFWNFLIPNVGAAPVTAFQVLITLFVLVIGPLNFYVLRRWHKLNLLLITVPASAAIVTAALLLYAVFTDGFGVRARTRSYTLLDQRSGEATCLGRATYYAGLAPAKGLSFTGDVAVYPLTDTPIGQYDAGMTRRLAWEFANAEDRTGVQRLTSGWLQSRTQMQLATFRSRKSDARLDIVAAGGRPVVVNRLGVRISFLLVRDEAGNYSLARDVESSGTSELAPLGDADRPAELTDLREQSILRPAAGVQTRGTQSIFGIRRRYYPRQFSTVQTPTGGDTSLLERSLHKAIDDARLRQLPPRSYVAVVDRSPEFEIGVENATEESSLHVIYGRW
jgi:hypothetical protein